MSEHAKRTEAQKKAIKEAIQKGLRFFATPQQETEKKADQIQAEKSIDSKPRGD